MRSLVHKRTRSNCVSPRLYLFSKWAHYEVFAISYYISIYLCLLLTKLSAHQKWLCSYPKTQLNRHFKLHLPTFVLLSDHQINHHNWRKPTTLSTYSGSNRHALTTSKNIPLFLNPAIRHHLRVKVLKCMYSSTEYRAVSLGTEIGEISLEHWSWNGDFDVEFRTRSLACKLPHLWSWSASSSVRSADVYTGC